MFSPSVLWYGFSQGFIIGPLSLYGIREGLNPNRGFWWQIQVTLGATIVDVLYLLAGIYGIASFIEYDLVQLTLWSLASYLLITMGVNSLHERPGRMNFHYMHRHKLKFFETDFVRAFLMNLVNPMAIIFSIVVFGGMYADFSQQLSPLAFVMNLTVSNLAAALVIAFITLAVRQIFHRWMLLKLMKAGSFILVGYGLWFFWKAASCVPELTVSFINFFNP